MSAPQTTDLWWKTIAALPEGPNCHSYFALRRVWGDHTISGPRSFYKLGTEDNVTPALFQNWDAVPHLDWVKPLLEPLGGRVGTVRRVRWAYACEELLDEKLRRYHGKRSVIPDLILHFEDEHGRGLIAFEVKKPGIAPEETDPRKLQTYCDLPSTRKIDRRYGAFLISESVSVQANRLGGRKIPILSWEELASQQIDAMDRASGLTPKLRAAARTWVARAFNRYGIGTRDVGAPPTPASDMGYGTPESYAEIDKLEAPECVARFFKGSEVVEAIWHGLEPTPPMTWLTQEPTHERIRASKWQKTHSRFVCRWTFDWDDSQEAVWFLRNR